jgi:hypothetical protein
MHLKSLFVDSAAGFRPFYQNYLEFAPIVPEVGGAIARSQQSPHALGHDRTSSECSNVPHRTVKQPVRRTSKTRQRSEPKFFQSFARAAQLQSGRLAKLKITRLFPCVLRLNTVFMLASLEPNISHNHLYDSILGHATTCIDSPIQTSKIELPKPQHVVSVRALDTIGCGFVEASTSLFRVLGN